MAEQIEIQQGKKVECINLNDMNIILSSQRPSIYKDGNHLFE
jgi:hypothetical protein